MKKIILITLEIILFQNISISQWVEQNGGTTATLYNVEFVSLNTGWITGVNGIILKTTNTGTNWIMQNSNLAQQRILTGIDMLDENTGFIVGWYSAILKTTSGGASWIVLREMPVGQGNSYHDVDFYNEQTGWVSGNLGYVWKTSNSGLTWDSVNVGGNGPLRDILFINNQTGWVAGDVGFMRKTTSGGQNWFVQITGTTADYDYNSLSFINPNTGWVVANNRLVFRTTNGGFIWDSVSLTPGRCLHFVNSLTGWTAGDQGDMYKSTNGGLNFYLQAIPVTGGFFTDITFVNDTVGWAIDVYVIMHTTNGGGEFVGTDPLSNEIPAHFKLNQNYPNPFNPNTKIEFEIPIEGNIKLIVYDILGKKIKTITENKFRAGKYTAIFNASEISSGIYFYTLIFSTGKITKKMTVIK